jgi:hypothetical protein
MSDTTEKQQTLVEHQKLLEQLFNKNQLLPRIRSEFLNCEEFSFVAYLTQHEIPVEFGIDLLAQMALHKRANLQTLIGVLFHHLKDAQLTADMLARSAIADLVDWSPGLKLFIVKFPISDDVQEELDRFQYPLPMVVKPKPIRTNRDTGYLFGSGSVILKNNHHEEDVCLDHLNRINQIKFTINVDVVRMVKNSWRNLDKAKEGETKEDFVKRKKAFEKYDRVAHGVMDILLEENDHFYFTHAYDKRGRTYCRGYHANYQGNPWNKAVISFADKEIVE